MRGVVRRGNIWREERLIEHNPQESMCLISQTDGTRLIADVQGRGVSGQ